MFAGALVSCAVAAMVTELTSVTGEGAVRFPCIVL